MYILPYRIFDNGYSVIFYTVYHDGIMVTLLRKRQLLLDIFIEERRRGPLENSRICQVIQGYMTSLLLPQVIFKYKIKTPPPPRYLKSLATFL